MTQFCTFLLLITLLFPPVTAASVSMACSVTDRDATLMDYTPEEPVDGPHACCTMPAPEATCKLEIVSDSYTCTCCDEVRIARGQGVLLTTPIPRYDGTDMSLPALTGSTDQTVDSKSISRIAPAHSLSFLNDLSPPLRILFCTYLI